jgi:hypothetical protein
MKPKLSLKAGLVLLLSWKNQKKSPLVKAGLNYFLGGE